MIVREQLQAIYLDWWNNFLTVRRFAEYYGINEDDATKLIDVCRNIHNQIAELNNL